MLQYVAAYCSTLQFMVDVEMGTARVCALQCVAVCCSVLQCVAVHRILKGVCVAVCCIVLQCVAMCCIVLQSVALCCIVFLTPNRPRSTRKSPEIYSPNEGHARTLRNVFERHILLQCAPVFGRVL